MLSQESNFLRRKNTYVKKDYSKIEYQGRNKEWSKEFSFLSEVNDSINKTLIQYKDSIPTDDIITAQKRFLNDAETGGETEEHPPKVL